MAVDWRHRASCRDEDPELFFAVGVSGPALLQIADAKTVCRRCPVADECLTWALERREDAGVWGGLSEDERRALRRRLDRTKARLGRPEVGPGEPAPDWVMVDRLVRHGGQPGASRGEIALAALRLVDGGRTANAAANHLHLNKAMVDQWVARAAAGEPLIQRADGKGRAA